MIIEVFVNQASSVAPSSPLPTPGMKSIFVSELPKENIKVEEAEKPHDIHRCTVPVQIPCNQTEVSIERTLNSEVDKEGLPTEGKRRAVMLRREARYDDFTAPDLISTEIMLNERGWRRRNR